MLLRALFYLAETNRARVPILFAELIVSCCMLHVDVAAEVEVIPSRASPYLGRRTFVSRELTLTDIGLISHLHFHYLSSLTQCLKLS